jgi:hypothetical protein
MVAYRDIANGAQVKVFAIQLVPHLPGREQPHASSIAATRPDCAAVTSSS